MTTAVLHRNSDRSSACSPSYALGSTLRNHVFCPLPAVRRQIVVLIACWSDPADAFVDAPRKYCLVAWAIGTHRSRRQLACLMCRPQFVRVINTPDHNVDTRRILCRHRHHPHKGRYADARICCTCLPSAIRKHRTNGLDFARRKNRYSLHPLAQSGRSAHTCR